MNTIIKVIKSTYFLIRNTFLSIICIIINVLIFSFELLSSVLKYRNILLGFSFGIFVFYKISILINNKNNIFKGLLLCVMLYFLFFVSLIIEDLIEDLNDNIDDIIDDLSLFVRDLNNKIIDNLKNTSLIYRFLNIFYLLNYVLFYSFIWFFRTFYAWIITGHIIIGIYFYKTKNILQFTSKPLIIINCLLIFCIFGFIIATIIICVNLHYEIKDYQYSMSHYYHFPFRISFINSKTKNNNFSFNQENNKIKKQTKYDKRKQYLFILINEVNNKYQEFISLYNKISILELTSSDLEDNQYYYTKINELYFSITNTIENDSSDNIFSEEYITNMQFYYKQFLNFLNKYIVFTNNINESSPKNTNDYFSGCNDLTKTKKRYRELMFKYHPDNGTGNEDIVKEINLQYKNQYNKFI